jgi:glycosyltransferase involved in cell wall biosynthesis
MRVLHVFKTFFPETYGGIEHVIDAIADGAVPLGVDSTVFCLSDDPSLADPVQRQYRVVAVKRNIDAFSTGASFGALPVFRELARDHDILHYHFPWPFMDLLHAFNRWDRPALVSYHSDIVRQRALLGVYRPIMHRFLSSMEAIVASSPAYLQSSPVLGRYDGKTHAIPYGIPDMAEQKTAQYSAAFSDPYFIFVGVHRYYKGLDYLIDAAPNTQADIVICGDGPETPDLRKRASGLSNVHFTGAIDDKRKFDLLRDAFGFVLPSHLRSEAFGIALLEGAMMSLPLISCEIGTGTTFINIDGETGLTVPPANPDALASAMNKLVQNVDFAKNCGINARARYTRTFTQEEMVGRYVDLYRKIAS